MKPGLIGLSYNKSGLFPKLIRFFTASQFSHTFVTFANFYGRPAVIEAGNFVQIVPFETHYLNDSTESYLLFEVNEEKLTPGSIDGALEYLFMTFSGATYGYLQLLWFLYRWLIYKLFGKKITLKKNWFSGGIICSELVYHFIFQLGGRFRDLLKDFTPDTIEAQDILEILQNNPDLFRPLEVGM